jgi:hypothetical protein
MWLAKVRDTSMDNDRRARDLITSLDMAIE